jgi:hypothetical protein
MGRRSGGEMRQAVGLLGGWRLGDGHGVVDSKEHVQVRR